MDSYSKHHFLALQGGPVSVYESGDETLPPVLLLHGAMVDEARLIWYHLAPFLSKLRHVYAVDFPRHGASRPWSGHVGKDTLYRVIDEVIANFNLPPLPFIGLSMGGGVTIGYALEHPERVTGAVLMGPGGLGDTVPGQLFSWLFIKTPGLLKYLTRYYAKLPPEKMRKTMIKMLNDGENSKNLEDLVALLAEESRQKRAHRENCMDDWQLEAMAPFRLKLNFLPELHRLTCPVLYLRGENDPLVGQSIVDEAVRLTPGAKLLVIKNAGHLIPLEQPDAVKKAVAEFLEENRI